MYLLLFLKLILLLLQIQLIQQIFYLSPRLNNNKDRPAAVVVGVGTPTTTAAGQTEAPQVG